MLQRSFQDAANLGGEWEWFAFTIVERGKYEGKGSNSDQNVYYVAYPVTIQPSE